MRNHPISPTDTSRRRSALGRDVAIGRVRAATGWIVAGAAVGTVVLVGVAAHEVPGHSAGASNVAPNSPSGGSTAPSSGAGPSSGSGSAVAPSDGGSSGQVFSPPPTNPAPTYRAPRVASGQS